ncbi:hypothetical protein FNQ90_16585 [Streptomyces alkaliphilus]|uniref:Uncharacterized protein n=1 Tax=Streptomyces alkaliphilus TaxID=1472722 RepID=A0A7W3TF29_9ACTN|nr:hypothetical protein [Streptomyces alkaliphilus]MBB0245674.1 hypothetical protein [Streptomyces alkaliphilus]
MWEARAVPGRAGELLDWARSRPLDPPPTRRETFVAPGDRVLVITWWDTVPEGGAGEIPEIPSPDEELLARPVHRWRFTRVEGDRTG